MPKAISRRDRAKPKKGDCGGAPPRSRGLSIQELRSIRREAVRSLLLGALHRLHQVLSQEPLPTVHIAPVRSLAGEHEANDSDCQGQASDSRFVPSDGVL